MGMRFDDAQISVLDFLAEGKTLRETAHAKQIPESEVQRLFEELASAADASELSMEQLKKVRSVELRLLQAKLWASEARLDALMDTAPEPIFLIDGRSGVILKVNNHALRLLGYTPRELIGQEMEVLVPPELAEVHVAFRNGFLNSVRKRAMGYHPPVRALTKSGDEVMMDIALTATQATDDVMVVCRLVEAPVPT